MKIALIVGPGSSVQGWGNEETTERLRQELLRCGHQPTPIFVTRLEDLIGGLQQTRYDLAWTSLYHISNTTTHVGEGKSAPWVLDVLDSLCIPYVGSGAQSMRAMLDKAETSRRLLAAGVAAPRQWICEPGQAAPAPSAFPVLIKPRFESESNGVSEASVVSSQLEMERQIAAIHSAFQQGAVIEEFLPGREFTVSMMFNGARRRFRPIEVVVDPRAYRQHCVLTGTMKTDGYVKFRIPHQHMDQLCTLASRAAAALECLDHVRIDIREGRDGLLKVIDVNGIPGLNPSKSRSLVIQKMYGVPAHLVTQTLIGELMDSVSQRLPPARSTLRVGYR